MALWRIILPAAVGFLYLAVIPAAEVYLRFSWQLISLWLAALVFCAWLSNGWRRLFWLLALLAVIRHGPQITAYIQLLMIAVFLAAAEGFKRLPPAHIFNALAAGALFLCAWIINQRLGWLPTHELGDDGAGPFNINAAAVYLALCLPAFLRDRRMPAAHSSQHIAHSSQHIAHSSQLIAHSKRGFFPFLSAISYQLSAISYQLSAKITWRSLLWVPILGLYLCHSTTGFGAALAAAGVYAITGGIHRRLILAASGAAALAAVFFILIDPIAAAFKDVRWHAWALIAKMAWHTPWGQGLGSFGDIFGLISADPSLGGIWRQAHNEYLQAAWEIGLAAGVLLAIYPLRVLIAAWRRRQNISETGRLAASGIAAVAVSCFGWHTMHIAPLALAAMAWIGLAEGWGLAHLWPTGALSSRF